MKKFLQDALFVFSAAAALAFGCAVLAEDTPDGVNLWPDGAPIDTDGNTEDVTVNLYPMLPENTAGAIPAVVICPGGGYGGLCIQPEGYDIARWLNDNGIAGFVLEYRLPAGRETVPLADAQRAIRFVRANAEKYGVDPNKIGIIGFSAGGHLASTAATHFDAGKADAADPIERVSCRPDFAILIYPVILFGDQSTHLGTQNNLLGKDQTREKLDYFSNEKHVGPETPPVLLAHAVDDSVVPIENSRAFARAMQRYNLPYVLVELPNGDHGLNDYHGPSWDMWQALAPAWIHRLP